jgi:hypothetical protein
VSIRQSRLTIFESRARLQPGSGVHSKELEAQRSSPSSKSAALAKPAQPLLGIASDAEEGVTS